jgi:hypothetical protein
MAAHQKAEKAQQPLMANHVRSGRHPRYRVKKGNGGDLKRQNSGQK